MVTVERERRFAKDGKSKFHIGSAWREGNKHYFLQWTVSTRLESELAHAFLLGCNADMTDPEAQRDLVRSTVLSGVLALVFLRQSLEGHFRYYRFH